MPPRDTLARADGASPTPVGMTAAAVTAPRHAHVPNTDKPFTGSSPVEVAEENLVMSCAASTCLCVRAQIPSSARRVACSVSIVRTVRTYCDVAILPHSDHIRDTSTPTDPSAPCSTAAPMVSRPGWGRACAGGVPCWRSTTARTANCICGDAAPRSYPTAPQRIHVSPVGVRPEPLLQRAHRPRHQQIQ